MEEGTMNIIKKNVLIIEDCLHWTERWKKSFNKEKICVQIVSSRKETIIALKNNTFDVIVVDGYLKENGHLIKTLSLVKQIRSKLGYTVPMIAISDDNDINNDLLKLGCNHKSTKKEMVDQLIKILKL